MYILLYVCIRRRVHPKNCENCIFKCVEMEHRRDDNILYLLYDLRYQLCILYYNIRFYTGTSTTHYKTIYAYFVKSLCA